MITGLKESTDTTTRKSDKEEWNDKEEWADKKGSTDLPPMSPLEGDKGEVWKGKWLKIFTPRKLLTRFPILLPQIKAGKISHNLKNDTRKILYPLYQHKKITKKFTI